MSEVRAFPHGPHDKKRSRKLFLTLSAVLAVVTLLVANDVLLPFVLALLVAYILLPLVLRIERMRVPRFAAILLVYAVVLGVIGGFIAVIVPSLFNEGRALKAELPKFIEDAETKWVPYVEEKVRAWKGAPSDPEPALSPDGGPPNGRSPTSGAASNEPQGPPAPTSDAAIVVEPRGDGSYDVRLNERVELRKVGDDTWRFEKIESDKDDDKGLFKKLADRGSKYFAENTVEVLKFGQQIISAVARGIFTLFMTLMLGAYMMLTHERIIGFFRELLQPDSQPAFDRLLRRLDRGLSGVVRGQLLICLVNGVLSAIGFWLFDLKYWPIISVLLGAMSLIPIFGSILSSVPAVAIGLTQSPGTALGGARVDRGHPPDRGELPQPQDHRRRRQDSPRAGRVLAARRRALLPDHRARSSPCPACRSCRRSSCTSASPPTARGDPTWREPVVSPTPGQLVNDKVRLVHLLGRGGMGSVWAARHEELDLDVAVKFIAPELLSADTRLVLARFRREAQLAAKLDNPHTVRVLDHGVSADGAPYIVMELLRGKSLSERLQSDQRVPLEEAVQIVRDIAAGLEHAHALGIVHRDIKPPNVFLARTSDERSVTKILDFGIAKSQTVSEPTGAGTGSGVLIGTPHYMSPEQLMRAAPRTRAPTSGRSRSSPTRCSSASPPLPARRSPRRWSRSPRPR
jgi:predicted PurR-regulated permease PerM